MNTRQTKTGVAFIAFALHALACTAEPRIHFLAEPQRQVAESIAAPSTAPIRALRHPALPALVATAEYTSGLEISDSTGTWRSLFSDSVAVEVDRDPTEPDTIVAFLEERSRFGIAQGTTTWFRSSNRYVRDFLLADYDLDGLIDIVALSEAGEVFVIPEYVSVTDFDSVGMEVGLVGPVPRDLTVLDRPHAIDMGDFDADGVPDVVAVTGAGGFVVFFGSGLESRSDDGVEEEVMRASLDDVPGDELVTRSFLRVIVRRWDGSAFQEYAQIEERADGIDVGDVTRDGREDILLVQGAGHVVVVAGAAAGTGVPRRADISLSDDIVSMASADFDGDGAMELALLRAPNHNGGCH